ncbi:MAG: ROK family protein [Planctomycetes bacterium]|nr:ROK family protein [Planctomycetota bacterium]
MSRAPGQRAPEPGSVVAAFDVGGTHLRAALVDRDGNVLARERVPSPRHDGPKLRALVRDVARELARAQKVELAALGLAIAGTIDLRRGMVRVSPSLDLHDLSLAEPLEEALGCPVVLVNDVNAAALAEAHVRNCDDLAVILVGTGVGTGFVSSGRLVEGTHGMAGEGGHLIYRPDGEACPLGCKGCFESYLGGESLRRRALATSVAGDTPGLLAAWRAGDVNAAILMDDALAAMEGLVTLVVNAFDPARIVLGGGVVGACPELVQAAHRAIRTNPLGPGRTDLPVDEPRLVDDAGTLGAARLAWARLEDGLRSGAPSGR